MGKDVSVCMYIGSDNSKEDYGAKEKETDWLKDR